MFGDEGFCRSLLSQMLGTRWLFGPILRSKWRSKWGASKIPWVLLRLLGPYRVGCYDQMNGCTTKTQRKFQGPPKSGTIIIPKTNSSPLKISLPKRKRSYSNHPNFRGYVVFREGIPIHTTPIITWHPTPESRKHRRMDTMDSCGSSGHQVRGAHYLCGP